MEGHVLKHGREGEGKREGTFEARLGCIDSKELSLLDTDAQSRMNNFIADHIRVSLTSQRASMNSSRETLPSPSTSRSLNMDVISRRLTLSFGDRFKSSISFLNYEKSM